MPKPQINIEGHKFDFDVVEEALLFVAAPAIDDNYLSDTEKNMVDRICSWLIEINESRLKDHFIADLSWAVEGDKTLADIQKKFGYATKRSQAIVNFFTKRMGVSVFDKVPEDIKNYVLALRLS